MKSTFIKNLFLGAAFAGGLCSFSSSMAESLLNGCNLEDVTQNGNSVYKVTTPESDGTVRTVYWLKQAQPNGYNYTSTSAATNECTSKTFNMPTVEDFTALRSCFEADPAHPGFLTEAGKTALNLKFSNGTWGFANNWYWSEKNTQVGFSSERNHMAYAACKGWHRCSVICKL